MKEKNKFILTSITFISLTVLYNKYLFNPPYWDAIQGAFYQALWLLKNNFNYIKLYHEPGYLSGGANIYYLNILPFFYAVLYKLFSPLTIFFILHILNILCSSIIIVLFYILSRKYLSRLNSTLFCVACLSNPIFSSQTATINMELFLGMGFAFSLYYFNENKIGYAAIWCVISYFFKSTAIVLSITYAAFVTIKYFSDKIILKKRFENKLFILITPFILISFLSLLTNDSGNYLNTDIRILDFLIRFKSEIRNHFPSIGITLIIFSVLIVINIFKRILNNVFLNLLIIFIIGFIGAYLFCFYPLPRYITSIIFPLFLTLGLLLKFYPKCLSLIYVLVIIYNCIGYNGRFLPALHPYASRAGGNLERSWEFMADLESNINICNFLENKYFESKIGVTKVFYFMLTNAELGYVCKPLPNIFLLSDNFFDNFKLNNSFENDTLFLYAPHYQTIPELNKNTKFIFIDKSLKGTPVFLFKQNKI